MDLEFINGELTESKLLRNEKNIPDEPDTIINSLMLHVLALEVLRHESPAFAQKYARKSGMGNYTKLITASTDLYNLATVIQNKDKVTNQVDIPSGVSIPQLQLTTYLRNIVSKNYSNAQVRQLLYKLQKSLTVRDSQLKIVRLAVQDWPGLTEQEKQGAYSILNRQFLLHSRRSDIYSAFKKVSGGKGSDSDKGGIPLAAKAAMAFAGGYALGKAFK